MCHVSYSVFIVYQACEELKRKGQGVNIGGKRVQLLLYADDIVLLAETPNDLHVDIARSGASE